MVSVIDDFYDKFVGTYTIPIDPMGYKGSTLPKTNGWMPETGRFQPFVFGGVFSLNT